MLPLGLKNLALLIDRRLIGGAFFVSWRTAGRVTLAVLSLLRPRCYAL
jgi:hypothetical protein